jgi:hypothetical protein
VFFRVIFFPLPEPKLFFLLRFCSSVGRWFVFELAAGFSFGLGHDECQEPTTQVPLL